MDSRDKRFQLAQISFWLMQCGFDGFWFGVMLKDDKA